MNYTTQMNAAKKGIITPEMKIVAAKEKMNIEKLIDTNSPRKSCYPSQ